MRSSDSSCERGCFWSRMQVRGGAKMVQATGAPDIEAAAAPAGPGLSRVYLDGPCSAPSQAYRQYCVLLLVASVIG